MDIAFDDVVAQNHADLLAVREMFGQRQRVGDTAFTFLVSVIQVFQPEFPAVGQQPQEVPGIAAPCHHHDLLDAGVHQGLDGVINHRLVVDRQQMLVGDLRQGK